MALVVIIFLVSVADKYVCDITVCSPSAGCWGEGPEHCRICAFWLISDGGPVSRCVQNCSQVAGGYFKIIPTVSASIVTAEEEIVEDIEQAVTGTLGVCGRCDPECGGTAGACFGPGADKCNFKCAHVKVSSESTHSTRYLLFKNKKSLAV